MIDPQGGRRAPSTFSLPSLRSARDLQSGRVPTVYFSPTGRFELKVYSLFIKKSHSYRVYNVPKRGAPVPPM